MTTANLNDLTPGTDYAVQIRKVNGGFTSEWSPVFEFTTIEDTIKPKTPTNVTWGVSGTTFLGEWDVVTQNVSNDNIIVARYEVELTGGNQAVRLAAVSATASDDGRIKYSLTFADNKALFEDPQPALFMRVRAIDNKDNKSDWTAPLFAQKQPPEPPTNAVVESASEAIALSWTASVSTDVRGYYVYVSTSAADFEANILNRVFTGDATAFIYFTSTFAKHYFKIRAFDDFKQESADLLAEGTPGSPFSTDLDPPDVPVITNVLMTNTGAASGATALVDWTITEVSDLAEFYLRFRKVGTLPWSVETFDKDTRQGIVILDEPYSDYEFQMRAADWYNNYTVWSPTFTASFTGVGAVNEPPETVTGLVAQVGGSTIQYRWNAVNDVDIQSYELMISTTPDFSSDNINFLTGAATALPVAGLNFNTAYYARVRALDVSGLYSVAWSSTVSVTTDAETVAPISDGLAPTSSPVPLVKGGPGRLFVSWLPVVNADLVTYEVHVSTTNNFVTSAQTKIGEVAGTSMTIEASPNGSPLTYNTTYFVRLVAKDRDGVGPVGNQASGQMVRATSSDIDANISSGNVWTNTSFNYPNYLDGWTLYDAGGTSTVSKVTGRSDGAAVKVTWTASEALIKGLSRTHPKGFRANKNYTLSFWARGSASVVGKMMVIDAETGALSNFRVHSNPNISTDWQRWVVTFQREETAHPVIFGIVNSLTPGSVEFDEIQLEESELPTAWSPNPNDALFIASADATVKADLAREASQVVAGLNNTKTFLNVLNGSFTGNNLASPIIIETPITLTNKVIRLKIEGYNYQQGNSSISSEVSFFAYEPGLPFLSTGQTNTGTKQINVALAINNVTGRVSLILTPIGSSGGWYNPNIKVTQVDTSFGDAAPDSWKSGWDLSMPASTSGYSYVTSPPQLNTTESTSLVNDWRFTGTTEINGGSLRTDTIDVIKLKANTTFTQNLFVKSTFVLGDSTTAGTIRSWDYNPGVAGFSLSSAGLDIRSGTVAANTIVAGTGIVNNLVVNTGGSIQSSNYSATAGWKISPTGIELNDAGSTIKADAIRAGSLGGPAGTNSLINIAAGTSIVVNGGYIKSNTYTGTTQGVNSSGVGWYIGNDGVRIDSGAVSASSLTAGAITGTNNISLVGPNAKITGTGFELSGSGLTVTSGAIAGAALKIQAGANLIPAHFADFEFKPTYVTGAGFVSYYNGKFSVSSLSWSQSGTYAWTGTNSLQLTTSSSGSPLIYFASSTSDTSMIQVAPSTQYIISWYMRADSGANILATPKMRCSTTSGNVDITGGPVTMVANGGWARYSAIVTTPANSMGYATLFYDAITLGRSFWMDGLQIEEKITAETLPSRWNPPGFTAVDGSQIRTGSIQSNNTVNVYGTVEPVWSIPANGAATFAGARIVGNTVIGNNYYDSTSIVQASSYSPGSTGWAIRGDGYAEFNNVTIRNSAFVGNTLQSTTYNSSQGWQINANGNAVFNNGSFRGNVSGSTITGSSIYGGMFQTVESNSGNRIRIMHESNPPGYSGTSSVIRFWGGLSGESEGGGMGMVTHDGNPRFQIATSIWSGRTAEASVSLVPGPSNAPYGDFVVNAKLKPKWMEHDGPLNSFQAMAAVRTPIPAGPSAVPLYINTDNSIIGKYTGTQSSSRYKILIEDYELEQSKKFLTISTRTWFNREDLEQYADYLTAKDKGQDVEIDPINGTTPIQRKTGMIAEELDEAGLSEFVYYDKEDRPNSIRDNEIPMAFLPLIKDLYRQIDELKERLN